MADMSNLETILREKIDDFAYEMKEIVDRECFISLLFCMFLSSLKTCGMNKKQSVELIQEFLNKIPADEFEND